MSKQQCDLLSLAYEIAINNSETAYERLFSLLFPSLKRFAFGITKSAEAAEEIASDVMITIWRNRSTLLQIDNITVYAYVIAKNLSLNLLKKNSKNNAVSFEDIDVEVVLNDPSPEQILITDELKKRLELAIERLPQRCKMVYKLIKEEGLSYKEAGAILGISIKTVDAQLVTAVRRIMLAVKREYNLP